MKVELKATGNDGSIRSELLDGDEKNEEEKAMF